MSSSVHPDAFLQAALTRLAPRMHRQATGISGLKRLSGGATQELWRFALELPDGSKPLILRRARGGDQLNEVSVGFEVEAQLISAAGRVGVPVPGVAYVLTPEDGLGQGFFMDFIDGETLGARIVKADALAAARPGLARACGDYLARIHSIDPADFTSLVVQTPAELIEQWRSTYLKSQVRRPVFDLAFHRLTATCPPPPAKPRVVHGDFRNGNLMIGPEGIRAVLDWELAHIGDPMEDLGYLCVNSWRFGRIDKPVGGFGDVADLYAGYEAAGGAPVNPDTAKWWETFGTLRWGAICADSLVTFREIENSVERAMIARRTSETEIDLLRLLGH